MRPDSVQLTVTVPASLADAGAAERAGALLVLDAVRTGQMSWRAAVDALGIAPDDLLDLAREHEAPVVRYESVDLADDLATLTRIERLRVRDT